MISATEVKRIPALIFLLSILTNFSLAQSPAIPSPEKPAPKVTYILAGRLFDATSDSVRENMVIAVENERIKSVALGCRCQDSAGRQSDRPLAGDRASRA